MPALTQITKVSDGPSEDAIINITWFAAGSSETGASTLLDVSTLDAPAGQVVKAVSIQQLWCTATLNTGFNVSDLEAFYILDSNNYPILSVDTFTDNYIDFCAGGCCPGLPDSDSVGSANGDLKYAVGNYTSTSGATRFSTADISPVQTGHQVNLTLRVRKIYEDA